MRLVHFGYTKAENTDEYVPTLTSDPTRFGEFKYLAGKVSQDLQNSWGSSCSSPAHLVFPVAEEQFLYVRIFPSRTDRYGRGVHSYHFVLLSPGELEELRWSPWTFSDQLPTSAEVNQAKRNDQHQIELSLESMPEPAPDASLMTKFHQFHEKQLGGFLVESCSGLQGATSSSREECQFLGAAILGDFARETFPLGVALSVPGGATPWPVRFLEKSHIRYLSFAGHPSTMPAGEHHGYWANLSGDATSHHTEKIEPSNPGFYAAEVQQTDNLSASPQSPSERTPETPPETNRPTPQEPGASEERGTPGFYVMVLGLIGSLSLSGYFWWHAHLSDQSLTSRTDQVSELNASIVENEHEILRLNTSVGNLEKVAAENVQTISRLEGAVARQKLQIDSKEEIISQLKTTGSMERVAQQKIISRHEATIKSQQEQIRDWEESVQGVAGQVASPEQFQNWSRNWKRTIRAFLPQPAPADSLLTIDASLVHLKTHLTQVIHDRDRLRKTNHALNARVAGQTLVVVAQSGIIQSQTASLTLSKRRLNIEMQKSKRLESILKQNVWNRLSQWIEWKVQENSQFMPLLKLVESRAGNGPAPGKPLSISVRTRNARLYLLQHLPLAGQPLYRTEIPFPLSGWIGLRLWRFQATPDSSRPMFHILSTNPPTILRPPE